MTFRFSQLGLFLVGVPKGDHLLNDGSFGQVSIYSGLWGPTHNDTSLVVSETGVAVLFANHLGDFGTD